MSFELSVWSLVFGLWSFGVPGEAFWISFTHAKTKDQRPKTTFKSQNQLSAARLFNYMKTQERLSDDNLVAVAQGLAVSRQQPPTAIDESPIRRTQVFNEILPVAPHDARMAARDFRLRVVGVQVNIREDSAVCVPTPYLRLFLAQGKLFSGGTTALYDQTRVRAVHQGYRACGECIGRF